MKALVLFEEDEMGDFSVVSLISENILLLGSVHIRPEDPFFLSFILLINRPKNDL